MCNPGLCFRHYILSTCHRNSVLVRVRTFAGWFLVKTLDPRADPRQDLHSRRLLASRHMYPRDCVFMQPIRSLSRVRSETVTHTSRPVLCLPIPRLQGDFFLAFLPPTCSKPLGRSHFIPRQCPSIATRARIVPLRGSSHSMSFRAATPSFRCSWS
jgi:hypothetical protein